MLPGRVPVLRALVRKLVALERCTFHNGTRSEELHSFPANTWAVLTTFVLSAVF